jgi:hypothetical protein
LIFLTFAFSIQKQTPPRILSGSHGGVCLINNQRRGAGVCREYFKHTTRQARKSFAASPGGSGVEEV